MLKLVMPLLKSQRCYCPWILCLQQTFLGCFFFFLLSLSAMIFRAHSWGSVFGVSHLRAPFLIALWHPCIGWLKQCSPWLCFPHLSAPWPLGGKSPMRDRWCYQTPIYPLLWPRSLNQLTSSPLYVSCKGCLDMIRGLFLLCSLFLGLLPAVLRNIVTSVLPDFPLSSAFTLSLYYSLFVFLGSFLFQRKRCPTSFQKVYPSFCS